RCSAWEGREVTNGQGESSPEALTGSISVVSVAPGADPAGPRTEEPHRPLGHRSADVVGSTRQGRPVSGGRLSSGCLAAAGPGQQPARCLAGPAPGQARHRPRTSPGSGGGAVLGAAGRNAGHIPVLSQPAGRA